MKINKNIITLKGVGDKSKALFSKVGVETVEDLLHYYPRVYERFENPRQISDVTIGRIQAIHGKVMGRPVTTSNRHRPITSLFLQDKTGRIKVIWYRMPFLTTTLKTGLTITLRGRVIEKQNQIIMEHPQIYNPFHKYEEKRHTLQPVYPLTSGLTNNMVQRTIKQVLESGVYLEEYLSPKIMKEYRLCSHNDSVRSMHFPVSEEDYINGRRRLVFEEFLFFILSIRRLKEDNIKGRNSFVFTDKESVNTLIKSLPYELTDAQKRVWVEIEEDLAGEHLMNRLIQGDVGSGKTIVAVLALVLVVSNGYQGAFMAPTQILATQHYENLKRWFKKYGIRINIERLSGSMTAKEKREAYERIASGEAQIIVGTNALIQERVNYNKLALVITDEQHRFGVKQRETFIRKGGSPHVLVMSATPIPRTLAVILYGDLDISIIDELPKNRLPIKNCVVDLSYRKTAHSFICKEVAKGHQCYIICPMVEESEKLDVENVIDYTKGLREELGRSIAVDYIHGRMKQVEKDLIMDKFLKNEIQVLVSTTVIEVGIDVPNATVILIENAQRFGLAQLHQLRGRVGRSIHQSYCIFMSSSKSKESRQRLEVLGKSNDGFHIANEDLRLRGPGDIFGIRQSGILGFALGDVYQDGKLLQEVNRLVNRLTTTDSKLESKENLPLAKGLLKYTEKHIDRLTL
jgi:ATP-dependent DNA helicase RecG